MNHLRTEQSIDNFATFLKTQLAKCPRGLSVEWKPWKKPRSIDQNAKLHAVIAEVCRQTGHTPDDMKTYWLGEFFGWRDEKTPKTPRNPTGYKSVPVRTTTTNEQGKRDVLPVAVMSDLIEFIHQRCAEVGVFVGGGA